MPRFEAANDNVPAEERLRLPQRSVAIGAVLLGLLACAVSLHAKDIERAFRGPRPWPTLVARELQPLPTHR